LKVAGQKLIFKGIELEDGKKLMEYNIISNDFVMMEFMPPLEDIKMIKFNITNWYTKKHICSIEFNQNDIAFIAKKKICEQNINEGVNNPIEHF